jgi:hypothetical protein
MEDLELKIPVFDDINQVEIDPDAAKWETLIDQIVEGNVIPVIGSDILMDGVNIEQYLIKQLAKSCGITTNPSNFSELLYDEKFKNRENIYFWLNSFCNNNAGKLRPSSLLKRLLSIKQFPFVITTSFFPIVENAMKEIWGERTVKSMVFSNNPATTRQKGVGDIVSENDISSPTVYYMFGKVCNSAHRFVVTDTDMLSFCSAWLSGECRPPVLSSVLKDKYLLVLGNNYPDWLFRFIWYSMNVTNDSKAPFSKIQGMMVNECADDNLIKFLNRLDTFTQKDPLYVIDTIERKLAERKDEIEAHRFDKPAKDCDVFISYSRTDSKVAEMLYDALTAKGLSVWYDKTNISTGADWMEAIERAIDSSRLFVPILSKNLESEGNDYHVYRKEWKIADRRAEGFNREFVIPLAGSTIDFYSLDLPKSFKAANAARYDEDCPVLTDFASDILEIINRL